ncbi:hypothetical protein [Segetibacter sp.]|jgi:hypothetical protein|uniref:hypothetical protein n=1 Tax=Segetibacter sp. TaxID=2231182 RepID=UPI002616ECE1|nr:hypothetical protein [Segetibacter sp.]MCW3080141.1 hypothetical protein [Segetibacter sp.]
MINIRELIPLSQIVLGGIFSLIFLIKIILFFKYEKEWNSITFFHFTKIQLKMTVSKELRRRRKHQNNFSMLMLILLLIFLVTSAFNLLIQD